MTVSYWKPYSSAKWGKKARKVGDRKFSFVYSASLDQIEGKAYDEPELDCALRMFHYAEDHD